MIGAAYAFMCVTIVYQTLKATMGIRFSAEEEFIGADLAIHKIGVTPEGDMALR